MRSIFCLIALLTVSSATGTTYTVSNVTDLVTYINSNNGTSGGGTVIIVNAGTYTLSTSVHASGDPNIAIDITQPITIQAAAGASPTITGANSYGIRVQASNTILDGLTISGFGFGVQVQNVSTGQVSGVTLRRLSVSSTSSSGQAIAAGGMLDSIIEYCSVTQSYNSGITVSNYPPISNTPSLRNLIINNSVANTTAGQGIGITLSDYNVIAGNTITDTAADGILVNGGQHNYIGQNTILRPGNGVTLTLSSTGRQSNRNYVGNNLMTLNAKAGTDTLWFDHDSDYNMGFLNEGSGAYEAGMSLFNSVGNYIRGNNWHNNPYGGIVVQRDPGSGNTTPTRNSIQQNYLHDHPQNGGITTGVETQNDYGFNYIAGTPATANQAIAGILLNGSTNSTFYSNVIRDLMQAEQIESVTISGTTYNSSGAVFFENRHVNALNHYLFDGNTATFDSGSTTLGGNYYSDFTSANGNPSNGSTPYTNVINSSGARVAQDNYPYAAENLGKNYNVAVRLPSTGSYLAVGTSKTIAWSSQGCMLVDIYLLNTDGSVNTTIASNTPDYGYYRWTVPAVTNQNYKMRVDCKLSSGGATGAISVGGLFAITTSDLVLLSPQSNLVIDSGLNLQISWKKSSAIAAVDVYIRYSDASAYTLVQGGVTADYLTIATPVTSSNRASVRIAYGGYGDSTDGWFTIRGSSSGSFTSPGSANNLYVGTPFLVEWVAPQTTDYVNIDLIGAGTKNIVTQLADFSSYLMLVPDQQASGSTLRLTFSTATGTILQQISSSVLTVESSSYQPNSLSVSGGYGQSASTSTAFVTPLQALVTNSSGTGVAGVSVTFVTPSSGASGSFSGGATVQTNSNGIATASTFTANSIAGSYTVTAMVGSLSASFGLVNTTAVGQTNVGYYYNGNFVLDANGTGQYEGPPGDKNFFYAAPMSGDIAVVGDWNHDGHAKAGIYRNGFWILDYNGNGVYDQGVDKYYAFGGSGTQYVPVVGDWNGDGRSKIGYYNNGFWLLDYNGNGSYDSADKSYAFGGRPNEIPLLGDWNHDGRTKIGVYYSGNFILDSNGDGVQNPNETVTLFVPFATGDKPVIGDWSGTGTSKIGIYRNGYWILDYNGNGYYDGIGPNQDKYYGFGGNPIDVPVVGDWNGSGSTKIGVYRGGFWAVDFNGNGTYDGSGTGQDRFIAFGGNSGEQPILGKW